MESCPSNPSFELDLHRRRAAEAATRFACQIGAIGSILAGLVDLAYRMRGTLLADGVLLGACFFSVRRHRPARWLPAYLGLAAACTIGIYATGGPDSPFFGEALVLLLVYGITIQISVMPGWIFAGTLLYAILWTALPAVVALPRPALLPVGLERLKALILLSAIGAGIWYQIWFQAQIARSWIAKSRELIDMQGKLMHTEKLAQVGDLVASTAHELSQPVQTVMIASTTIAKMQQSRKAASEPDLISKLNERVTEAAARLARMLRQLRDFSRDDGFQPELLDLRQLLQAVEQLARMTLLENRIHFRFSLPEVPLFVLGDSVRLQQVLLNLMTNARDACRSQGVPHHPGPSIRVNAHPIGPWARIEVANTGAPIPLEIWNKLFQPYFTTKERGRGTGLGLRICSQLVEQHGGRIFFSSCEQETIFVVDLPSAANGDGTPTPGRGESPTPSV